MTACARRRLWALAWPLSGMEVMTFAKELIITAFVGHLGPIELSSLVLSQTLYNVSGNAPMLGVVTAMETFCGQAYGAKKYATVGVVTQRALVITTIFNILCIAMWGKSESLMLAMGQDPDIARAAGRFTLMLSPCLLLDGFEQCIRRYLACQSVVQPLMYVTFLATMLTPLYLWFFIVRCSWGFEGAALAWICVQASSFLGLLIYTIYYTYTQEPSKRTWMGWTSECLTDWPLYIRVAIPSAVMICLDWWTFEIIVMLSGLLPRPEMTMSMMGITFNIHALCFFAAHGLSGAASTRVGNELGASRPRQAWLNTQVSVLMGTVIMMVCAGLLLLGRDQLGAIFAAEREVVLLTSQAVPTLAISLIGEGANTVLAGVLRGCGRQKIGAQINLFMYWGIGLPFACLLAFRMGLGAMGLWTGLACTASLQSLILSWIVFKFDWNAEAQRAKALIASGELEIELDEEVELLASSGRLGNESLLESPSKPTTLTL
ncbi:MATE efflux family protein 5 [Tetrabaena socialis]|uniref:Protein DETOXIFICATION n=1 Tax=Tetrabaena socialis TaxID=47790 RepID=A0A2J7ZY64_9CHLO|nr:MATE efflux family protein 5 [Tetrabaena socialis]|eukprot:PNH05195.1 MATE efflux family protein 5 [Tetrabaena socialis]